MSIAALMEQMIDAGAPMAAVLIAVRAIEERDRADAERRAGATRRKQQQRERDRSRDGHVTVTGQSQDSHDETPSFDKEGLPQTPFQEINSIPVRETRERVTRLGTRLPEGWKPTKLNRDTVAGQIIESRGQDWARRSLESFDNHWRSKTGKDAVKADWQKTWANWVIEQDRRDGRNGARTGTHGVAGNDGFGITTRAALAFLGDPPH
jgi:hypothetical protein